MNKGESEYHECIFTALLIHSVLFAYQKSFGKMTGSASRAILQFTIEYLPSIMKELQLPEIDREKSIEENISSYILMLQETGYINKASLIQSKENEYIIEVEDCRFAPCVHEIFESEYICPFAILAASVIYLKKDGSVSMEHSEFRKTGSRTVINVINNVKFP